MGSVAGRFPNRMEGKSIIHTGHMQDSSEHQQQFPPRLKMSKKLTGAATYRTKFNSHLVISLRSSVLKLRGLTPCETSYLIFTTHQRAHLLIHTEVDWMHESQFTLQLDDEYACNGTRLVCMQWSCSHTAMSGNETVEVWSL